ncbi:uncharacterized protein LOC119099981 [Pollicipes pollicipes]|uniref:uncharacterized protein LOC119099981 n=1 Tax=Pollicipes pollicipes TaxID=41117 RepID=UPI0018850442|nr:uncharacterized protein LOC119099981 [Pollicipes pollicipes]
MTSVWRSPGRSEGRPSRARPAPAARHGPAAQAPVLCAVLLSLLTGAGSLQMQNHVIPSHLLLGQTADLVCRYRLENETLYSVKWYKDNEEFYNFIATPKIAKRMYPLPGIRVDMAGSSRQRVRLLQVDFATSGKYGCEVSVDAPSFDTVIVTGHILVVAAPESPPQIEGGKDLYRLGDELSVNCTSRRSKPAALLNWHINGQQAPYRSMVQYPVRTDADGRETRRLGLVLAMQPHLFADGHLVLRCSAAIAAVYQQQTELSVRQPAKRPPSPAKTLEIKEQNSKDAAARGASGGVGQSRHAL